MGVPKLSLDQFAKKVQGFLTDIIEGGTRALAKKHNVPRQSPPLLSSGEHPQYLPHDEEDDHGPELRECVLVLDVSGSMSSPDWKPSRLAAAKAAAREFATALAETDPHAFLGVVAYGSEAHIACALIPVRQP